MLSFDEIVKKIKTGDVAYTDKSGNNLLHLLMGFEEKGVMPVSLIQSLLEKNPTLAGAKNKAGDLPTDIMDRVQPDDKMSNRPVRRIIYRYMPEGKKKDDFRSTFQTAFIDYQGSKTLDFEYIKPEMLYEKPAVLCFSGRGGFSPGFVTGVSRVIFNSMGLENQRTDGFRFIGVRYPGYNWDLCNDYRVSHDTIPDPLPPDHPYHYVRDFVTSYFHPLYTNDAGEKLAPKKAARNLQSFILMGYSYGASVIHNISKAMADDMAKLNYSSKEIAFVQSQIPAVLIGPSISENAYVSGFRSYHILSITDNIVSERVKPLLARTPQEKQSFIQTHLKKQHNQQVFLINEPCSTTYPTHHIKSYVSQESKSYILANLWKDFILFNALNHAVMTRKTAVFLPLAHSLSTIPDNLLFMHGKSVLSQHKKLAMRYQYDSLVRTKV